VAERAVEQINDHPCVHFEMDAAVHYMSTIKDAKNVTDQEKDFYVRVFEHLSTSS